MFALFHTFKNQLPNERFAQPTLYGALVENNRLTWVENSTICVAGHIPKYPQISNQCEFWVASEDVDLAIPELIQSHKYDPQILATGFASSQVLVYTYFPNEPWRVYRGLQFGNKQLIHTGSRFHILEAKHYNERNSAEYFVSVAERKLLYAQINDTWKLRHLWPEAYNDVQKLKESYS